MLRVRKFNLLYLENSNIFVAYLAIIKMITMETKDVSVEIKNSYTTNMAQRIELGGS